MAAHEFGHLLGLYDEYKSNNATNKPGVVNPDDLCYLLLSPVLGNWQKNNATFCNSLMADYGPDVPSRYLDEIVEFINNELFPRTFVLGPGPLGPAPFADLGPLFSRNH